MPTTEATMTIHPCMGRNSLQMRGMPMPKTATLGFLVAKLPKVAPKMAAEA